MSYLLLIVGFVLLIKGADIFVEGSSSIARRFNLPPMVIGLTIVAMGTSAPEAAVSISSSIAGHNDISIANVIGSNMFNILVVLGVSSLLSKLPVNKNTIKKDMPFLLFVSILLAILSYNFKLDRIDGVILLVIFTYFIIKTVKVALNNTKTEPDLSSGESAIAIEQVEDDSFSMIKTLLLCVVGAVGIVYGGDLVVDCASKIAVSLGMSQNLVGLTIVAAGTSLPEFVTSIIAIRKGETEIAIGNVIGSNLFNILFVLGIAATIHPMTVSSLAFLDMMFATLCTVILFLFIKTKKSLVKGHGMIFVLMYVSYMIYSIVR